MKENNIIQQKNKKSNEKYRIKNENKTTSTSTTTTAHTKKNVSGFVFVWNSYTTNPTN